MLPQQARDNSIMDVDAENKDFFVRQVDEKLDHFFSAALRLTRNRSDAEDLVAEAISRAWSNLHNLQDRDRFVPWVLRIITNVFISDCRKASNKHVHHAYHEEYEEGDDFSIFGQLHQPFLLWWGNPEQEFINNLLQEDIEKALNALPDNHRIMVMLADMEGLTYQEISEALEIPVGTVRSRLSRARGQMQKTLWEHAQDRELSSTQEGRGHE